MEQIDLKQYILRMHCKDTRELLDFNAQVNDEINNYNNFLKEAMESEKLNIWYVVVSTYE